MSTLPICRTCGREKKPIGRDAPAVVIDSYCHYYGPGEGCAGYLEDPQPVSEWPSETRARKARHSKRCNICGRFVPAEGPWPCVFWDDYMGAWEHA